VLLRLILAALQQWVGINVIFNYAEEIYRSAGFGVTDTLLNIVATGVIALIANILAVPLVDSTGGVSHNKVSGAMQLYLLGPKNSAALLAREQSASNFTVSR